MHLSSTRTSAGEITSKELVCYYGIVIKANLVTIVATSTASSEDSDHPASHAIDDDPEGQTCYHSKLSSHSWWEADFGTEVFIREIFIQLKVCL